MKSQLLLWMSKTARGLIYQVQLEHHSLHLESLLMRPDYVDLYAHLRLIILPNPPNQQLSVQTQAQQQVSKDKQLYDVICMALIDARPSRHSKPSMHSVLLVCIQVCSS